MDNREALDFLNSHSSIRAATEMFLKEFQIPDSEFCSIRRKFSEVKSEREVYSKQKDLHTWEHLMFHSLQDTSPSKKCMISTEKLAFSIELPQDIRKPLSELTLKALRIVHFVYFR